MKWRASMSQQLSAFDRGKAYREQAFRDALTAIYTNYRENINENRALWCFEQHNKTRSFLVWLLTKDSKFSTVQTTQAPKMILQRTSEHLKALRRFKNVRCGSNGDLWSLDLLTLGYDTGWRLWPSTEYFRLHLRSILGLSLFSSLVWSSTQPPIFSRLLSLSPLSIMHFSASSNPSSECLRNSMVIHLS